MHIYRMCFLTLAVSIAVFSFSQEALAAAPAGNFDIAQPDGMVSGWTFDPDTPSQSIQVLLYIGGPAGQGTLIGTTTANVPRPDVNTAFSISGDHGFSFQVPSTYFGGTHQVYAYAVDSSGTGAPTLVPGSPKTLAFTILNKQVIGAVDSVTADGTIIGWAYDPDAPTESIYIAVYVDGAAGQGTLAGYGRAILPRADVNSAYNITGAHGFSMPVLHTYIDGNTHTLYVYGMDLSAGVTNLQLQHSPQTIKINPPPIDTRGNATLKANGITIKTTARVAGAIDSLVWNNKEFVDSADHGRQIQTAWTGNAFGECFNPTEAGSGADASAPYSTSKLISLTKSSNTLTTKSNPAFWQDPNTYGAGCNFDSSIPALWNGGVAQNTTKTTRSTLQKSITIGVSGLSNVIKYTSKITFDAQELAQTPLSYIILENPAVYMPTDFKRVYILNAAGGLVELGPNVPNFNKFVSDPVILATDDGKYALGLYTPEIPRSGYASSTPQYGYIGYGIYNWGVSMGMDTRAPKFPTSGSVFTAGTYTYTSYLAVGTLQSVKSSLQKLSKTVR